MSELLEIEFKVLLTKNKYLQIINDYQDLIINKYTQTNYYLMHPKLDELSYMLRIREKNNEFELTLKRPNKLGNLETNLIISKDIKDRIFNHEIVNNEIFDLLKQVGINNTELITNYYLTTKRIDIKQENGLLSLDYNTYNQHQDYELEYEVINYELGKESFLKFIKKYDIKYTNNCNSKIKRLKLTL